MHSEPWRQRLGPQWNMPDSNLGNDFIGVNATVDLYLGEPSPSPRAAGWWSLGARWSCRGPPPAAGTSSLGQPPPPRPSPLWYITHEPARLNDIAHRRRINTEEKVKVVAAVWGDRMDSIPCRTGYFSPGWFEEKDEWWAATWWKGCFGKMDDNPVHTIPNHHPTIRGVLLKTFVQIIIAVKWLVRHSSMNQQPGPFAFSSVFNPSSNM